MMYPTIHMNGTAACDLLAAYREALEAVSDAIGALAKTAPNGRDYYPQGNDAIRAAGKEHGERMLKLGQLMAELECLAMHCIDRIPEAAQ